MFSAQKPQVPLSPLKKEEKARRSTITLFFIVTEILLILIGVAVYNYRDLKDQYDVMKGSAYHSEKTLEKFKMCGSLLEKNQFGITGIYYHDKYYCVWIQDRYNEEIIKTEQHEICHHLIYEDREHFCEGK